MPHVSFNESDGTPPIACRRLRPSFALLGQHVTAPYAQRLLAARQRHVASAATNPNRCRGKVLLDEHADVIREAAKAVAAEVMELEVSELIGAERGERRPQDRAMHRNGYRARRWDTRAGEVELQTPKIRQGSYFPSFLEPRRGSEQALLSVVQQAYVCGVSTRRVDQLVESLGLRVSKSEVSWILRCARRARGGVPDPAAGGPLPLRVPGRQGREGPRRRPRGRQGAGDRARSPRDRSAGDPLDRCRRVRDRGVLDRLPHRPGQARPGRRPTRDQRRARRAEGRDRQGPGPRLATLHRRLLRDCLGHARKDQHEEDHTRQERP